VLSYVGLGASVCVANPAESDLRRCKRLEVRVELEDFSRHLREFFRGGHWGQLEGQPARSILLLVFNVDFAEIVRKLLCVSLDQDWVDLVTALRVEEAFLKFVEVVEHSLCVDWVV